MPTDFRRRFTLLRHIPFSGISEPFASTARSDDLHWDFLLEPEQGDALPTWAFAEPFAEPFTEPGGLPTAAFEQEGMRLPDHRRVYLDYEGEVSGNRGRVEQLDTGFYERLGENRYRLDGRFLSGILEIRPHVEDDKRVTIVFVPKFSENPENSHSSTMTVTTVLSLPRGTTEAPPDLAADLVIPFLYDLRPDTASVRRLRQIEGELRLLTDLPPRAAEWLLRFFGISVPVTVLPLSEGDASRNNAPPERVLETVSSRWYPVIDRDACIACLECVNFCMFGVYIIAEDGKPLVEQPDACRNGCPACSRVCPGNAIMFPLHEEPFINGLQRKTDSSGDETETANADEQAHREKANAFEKMTRETSQESAESPLSERLDGLVDGLDLMEF